MRRFICYRPNPPEGYRESGAANPPDEPQFEGVVFSDGTVCIRWLTEYRSHSVWTSYEDLLKIHGHPEYGTRIEWLDDPSAWLHKNRSLADIDERLVWLLRMMGREWGPKGVAETALTLMYESKPYEVR